MTRQRRPSKRASRGQGERDLAGDIKAIQKRTKELLAKAGKDVRQVRHEVSQLKRAGIASARIDARSYRPTRYMLRKLEANRDILAGESIAVPASKAVREKYAEKGLYEARGRVLIIPKEFAGQRTRISRGMVEVTRELKNGEERRITLPFKATDMEQVARYLQTDPSLDGIKEDDEMFGFRLFGHSMATFGFPTADELGDYILNKYQHLFSGKNGREGVKHFVLFRFKATDSKMREGPESMKVYGARSRRSPGNDWLSNQRRERDAERKAAARQHETPAERAKRLDDQRERSRANRQTKYAAQIEKKSGLK
jgi:hypothetical protein